MIYNRLILLFLIIFSVILNGCSQEEEAVNPRMDAYVLTATQDQRNLLKYQFRVTYQGKELTSNDASFLWNFGDAAGTSTEAAPVYEYVEKGERKVSVSIIMNSNANGVSERVSQDTIILVGEQSTIYDSVITAYAGEGVNLLDYKLVSSAIASEETGGALNYLWKVTGPDGENGATITTTYPAEGEEPLTGNSIDHTFKRFGNNYNIDLYIKSADAAEYDMSSPTANLYLTTALPTITISCESLGKQNNQEKVRCKPNFDYDIKYGMEYQWSFYSTDGSSIVKDGDVQSKGEVNVEFSFSTSGTKLITVKGTHPTDMIGTVEGSVTLVLSSAGVLNPITCYRPTDNLGNFTDKTKLQYVCEAQGYYNNRNNLDIPLPLTSYTWSITEDGTEYDGGSFSWNNNTDKTGVDYTQGTSNSVITRVDCDESKNICTTTLKFTADKYGAVYKVSLNATQTDQDNAQQTHKLTTSPVLVNVEMPKITGITRETSEDNPMQSVFTPTYDTEIPTDKILKYFWEIKGTKTAASTSETETWHESAGGSNSYDGNYAITDRTLTHTFSQSADYAIILTIKSDKFSNGTSGGTGEVTMPSLTDNAHMLNFELNQDIAGSYFNASVNALTGQIRFYTDYEARVDNQPVDTTYVYTVTGPTYNDPSSQTTNTLTFHNKKEFETIVPKADAVANNNLRLLFNATYTVKLEVYNTAVYNADRENAVEGATLKTINTINGNGNTISTPTITFSENTEGFTNNVFNGDSWNKGWNTQMYAILDSTLQGTNTTYGIDRSLFNCTWRISDNTSNYQQLSMGFNEPIEYANPVQTLTSTCDNRILISAKGVSSTVGTQYSTVRITGPAYDRDTNRKIDYTGKMIMRYQN